MPFKPELCMRYAEVVTRSLSVRLALLQLCGVRGYEPGELVRDVLARLAVVHPQGALDAAYDREVELEAAFRRGESNLWRPGLKSHLADSKVTLVYYLGRLAPRVEPYDPALAAAEDMLFAVASGGGSVCQAVDPGAAVRSQRAPLLVFVHAFQVRHSRKATPAEQIALARQWNDRYSRPHKDFDDLRIAHLLRLEWGTTFLP